MPQQLSVLDETFAKTEVTDVIAVVVKTKTSLVNQRTQLVNHVNEKIVMVIPHANLVTTTKLTSRVK